MAVGLQMKSTTTTGGVTLEALPLIASMVTLIVDPTTSTCSYVTGPTDHVPYTAESAADCPGLTPSAEPHITFGSEKNRVGRGLRAMSLDYDSYEVRRPPKINKGAYEYDSSEDELPNSFRRSNVTVKHPTSGKKYNLEITYEADELTRLERDTIGLSLGMLPARDRTDLYEKLRSAPNGTAQVHLLADAVLDYTRATASLAKEIRDCVRLYCKIRTHLVGVTEVDYARDSVSLGLKFKPTSPESRQKVKEMTKETYRQLSKEADCDLGEEGDCPDWVERLAQLESQFWSTAGKKVKRVWQKPTAWELE